MSDLLERFKTEFKGVQETTDLSEYISSDGEAYANEASHVLLTNSDNEYGFLTFNNNHALEYKDRKHYEKDNGEPRLLSVFTDGTVKTAIQKQYFYKILELLDTTVEELEDNNQIWIAEKDEQEIRDYHDNTETVNEILSYHPVVIDTDSEWKFVVAPHKLE